MRRRGFFALLGALAVGRSGAVRAQPALPEIGFLHSAAPGPFAFEAAAFRDGLADGGFVDGRNVAILPRWAEGRVEALPALAAELAARRVALIAALGGDAVATAAMAAAPGTPIVFLNGSDPVRTGLVASIGRPGGNVTGVSLFAGTVEAKRLELLRELLPAARRVAVLTNALVGESEARAQALADAAAALGLELSFLPVAGEADFEGAFAAMAERRVDALFVSGSPVFQTRRERLLGLAARHALPTVGAWRDLAVAGALMSYGASIPAAARQAGQYAARILKGERPADLPVLQPTGFELVLNLATARTLGITVPPLLLARADTVIE